MSPFSMGELLFKQAGIALLVTYPLVKNYGGAFSPEPESGPGASSWVNSRTRRALDIAVASVALLVLFPVLLFCWLLVRLSSPGPVFFRQDRMGRYGREFTLFKFRSMRPNSYGVATSHTVVDDHRITPAGVFLRRYKLDELPQFWNVLKGDMSLVGPRPKLAHHEGLHMPYRPGLTGPATLAFRHEERMLLEISSNHVDRFYQSVVKPIKAGLDCQYMQSATLLSDLRILWCTFVRCVRTRADARGELCVLIEAHAPEYSRFLRREFRAAPPRWAGRPPSIVPEFTDDLVANLDDAA